MRAAKADQTADARTRCCQSLSRPSSFAVIGAYGDIFERNLGKGSVLKIDCGLMPTILAGDFFQDLFSNDGGRRRSWRKRTRGYGAK
ncbi:MAG: hypothetical protein AB9866_17035 [Syntrophobacteraceae bacterium]